MSRPKKNQPHADSAERRRAQPQEDNHMHWQGAMTNETQMVAQPVEPSRDYVAQRAGALEIERPDPTLPPMTNATSEQAAFTRLPSVTTLLARGVLIEPS